LNIISDGKNTILKVIGYWLLVIEAWQDFCIFAALFWKNINRHIWQIF
jgi:hypothetical protein